MPVTPLSDVQIALAESEARYRQLVESASDGIYRISVQGFFLYANPIACRVLAGGQSLIGRHYLEFVRQDFHADIQRFYIRQVTERTPSTYYEFPAVGAAGEDVWIGQRVHLELDDRGHVKGLHAIARDISDRKRLEDELRQSDKMRVVGQLAGGIAHDFNSLLTAICGFSDLLTASFDAEDVRRADVIEIRKAADKAARLTSQLLTFSRRQLFRPHVLNVNDVVTSIQPMLAHLVGLSCKLDIHLDPALDDVYADMGHLEQVLFNLALNARDAMPHGGTFSLITQNTTIQPGDAHEVIFYPGKYVQIIARDTGIGMDEATRKRIFEPFFSTKPESFDGRSASGLGLATTYGIIKQAGGRIAVESAAGQGTTFSIYLPRSRNVITPHAPMRKVEHSTVGRTVLVVDDDAGVRNVLSSVLEGRGFHVIAAANGIDALAKAKQHPTAIDLLITDVTMPQMSGAELAEALTAEWPSVRVLFISARVDHQELHDRYGRDNLLLLSKPFDSKTLFAAVERSLT